ncbi:hypothetical protein FIU97_10315 [Roseivivax sp. THAF40]|uniref:hypothetical protein n=1 Tax=unclassified Roseivivax TaxID=2639302 RepID=UPI0012A78F46|nr:MULTISPECIES: hypothetical protein [unclassified Roseivivax]QFS83221.1 hypothetical protein FIV09_10330 [Roseivivax sp. THAF197b]QFT46965.1 hypothetical protein FIU97_10315 [Roseivivax sp. THAF40]
MSIRIPLVICLAAGLSLPGCGTRLNPFNWFGQAESVPVATDAANPAATNPLIPQRRAGAGIFRSSDDQPYQGRPIAQVSELSILRRPGGAVVTATGLAPTPGRYEARLTPVEINDQARLVYSLDARLAPGPAGTGPNARSVTVAVYLTDQELSGIREIEVRGAGNALVTRR